MFFIKEDAGSSTDAAILRESYLELARTFSFNVIVAGDATLRYTCNELGMGCDLWTYEQRGQAMPLCCRDTLAAMGQAVYGLAERLGMFGCAVSGNTLNVVKMPRHIFPWERDQGRQNNLQLFSYITSWCKIWFCFVKSWSSYIFEIQNFLDSEDYFDIICWNFLNRGSGHPPFYRIFAIKKGGKFLWLHFCSRFCVSKLVILENIESFK